MKKTDPIDWYSQNPKKYPNYTYIQSPHHKISCIKFISLVKTQSLTLLQLGLRKGDRVGIISPNNF